MTEAAIAAIDHRFASEAAKTIVLRAIADNPASASVLIKLGFVATGRAPKFSNALECAGLHIDYCLERNVWRERRQA